MRRKGVPPLFRFKINSLFFLTLFEPNFFVTFGRPILFSVKEGPLLQKLNSVLFDFLPDFFELNLFSTVFRVLSLAQLEITLCFLDLSNFRLLKVICFYLFPLADYTSGFRQQLLF